MFEFIVLSSFCGSLATKCLSLNDEPGMVSPTLFYLTHVELNYSPFIINVAETLMLLVAFLSCVLSKTKNVNAFNIITTINKA